MLYPPFKNSTTHATIPCKLGDIKSRRHLQRVVTNLNKFSVVDLTILEHFLKKKARCKFLINAEWGGGNLKN